MLARRAGAAVRWAGRRAACDMPLQPASTAGGQCVLRLGAAPHWLTSARRNGTSSTGSSTSPEQTAAGASAADITRRLARIEQLNSAVHALPVVFHEQALLAARESDQRRLSGALRGPVDGMAIAVKDNFCVQGSPTTCASRALESFSPPYTATVVERLQAGGAVLVGKSSMDEFGMGSNNTHGIFEPVVNPRSLEGAPRSAGGSSGGSAAAVAAGMCRAAVGSDTGGSVRLPAAYCGVVGWKPSYGRCSRHGLVAYASSLDTPGVLAETVADAAAVANVMSGVDAHDSTSMDAEPMAFVPSGSAEEQASLANMTVGIPIDYNIDELTDAARGAWMQARDCLERLGATVKTVELPATRHALPCYYILALAEASSNLARYDGMEYGHCAMPPADAASHEEFVTKTRSQSFGEEVVRRILLGSFVLSRESYQSYYVQAQRVRRMVAEDFKAVFGKSCDLLLTPVTTGVAPLLADIQKQDPLESYAQDVFTVPASLAGLPALSLPVARDGASGMPLSVQLLGARGNEEAVLVAGHALTQALAPT